MLTDAEWGLVQRKLRLTARQMQVLRCVFEEQTDDVIADQLGITSSAVRAHLKTLFRKCKCRTRTGTVVSAFRAYVEVRERNAMTR